MRRHLEKLRLVRRKEYHPLIHHLHKKYGLSKRTLLYVKEYGPHTHVSKTIIRESIRSLIFASIISSLGGFALERIKELFVSIIPLIILLPTLNDMIGDYGTIFSSRFATLLHTGEIKEKWYKNRELKILFVQVAIISVITTLISTSIALIISPLSGQGLDWVLAGKVFLISIIDVTVLVNLLFIMAILLGLHYFRKNEDPDNFLIPITTSVADFGNMIILAFLVLLFF